jgi:hypothetical protein
LQKSDEQEETVGVSAKLLEQKRRYEADRAGEGGGKKSVN